MKKKFVLAPLGNIDRRLIKNSTKRLVLSGGTIELYDYERPYFYNKAPDKIRHTAVVANTNAPRREDNLKNGQRTIRRLIACNERAWGERIKFITFTFAKNIQSIKEANAYWEEFSRRARLEFGSLKYLAVIEFQKRGAIHYHVLYFNFPYTKELKNRIAKLWNHGFIKIITLKDIRSIGAYVSKYLQKNLIDKRLNGKKAFFCSKGLKKPQEFRNEQAIAKFMTEHTIMTEMERTYNSTHYGEIHYKYGHLIH